jgi:hypothetical protein
MGNKYKLVNPYIKGEFETKVGAKNSAEAAKIFYKNLSEHFNNNVPRFYFTIQKGGSGKGKFYHFEVKEKKVNDSVDFTIKPFEIKGEEDAMKQYLENFDKFKGRFNGGAHGGSHGARKGSRKGSKKSSRRSSHRYEDDISSDSDDFYREAKSYVPVTSSPFYYMYYDPLLYKVDSVFIPTYYAYVAPFSEINTIVGSYTVYMGP